jgi:hypothetical protein
MTYPTAAVRDRDNRNEGDAGRLFVKKNKAGENYQFILCHICNKNGNLPSNKKPETKVLKKNRFLQN